MRAFNLQAAIVVIGVLAAAVMAIDCAIYLSIDPGSLSAQMPIKAIATSLRGRTIKLSAPPSR
jgi:hypothetical protein